MTWQCSLDGMRLTDEQGRMVMVNDAFCRLMQKPREELEGQMMSAPYALERATEILAKHCQLFRDRTVAPHLETMVTLLNGRRIFLELSNSFMEMPGRPPLLLSVFRDITERKEAEEKVRRLNEGLNQRVQERTAQLAETNEALKKSEAKYRRLHDSMTDAFVSVSMDGFIQESNRAYQEMLGYSADELQRLTYVDLTPEKWWAMESQIVADEILPRGHSAVYEKEYRRKDGTVFPVELRTILLRNDAGQPEAMWAIVRDITLRKQAEEEIRRLNQSLEERVRERTTQLERAYEEIHARDARLRMTLEAASVVAWEWDLASGAIRYSENLPTITHGQATEPYCLVETLMAEIHPDDREGLKRTLDRTVTEGCPFEREYRVRMLDGEYRWILGKGRMVVAEEGKPARVLGVSEDITERKRAAELIQTQAQMLASLSEGVHLVDQESMKILFANPAMDAMFGYEPGELIGRSALELLGVPSQELPALRQSIRHTVMVAGGQWSGEALKRRKDGTTFPSEAQVSGIMLNGRFCYIVLERDISQRKQAEVALRQSLQRYVTLSECSPDSICVLTQDGLYLYVNSRHARWVGRPVEEFAGRNLVDLWSPKLAQRLLAEFRQVLAGGEPATYERPSLLHPDRWMEMRLVPLLDTEGIASMLLVVARDITERKRAEVTRETLLSLESKLNAAGSPHEAARIIFEAADRLWRWDSGTLDLYFPNEDRVQVVMNFDVIDGHRREVDSSSPAGKPTARMRRILTQGPELMLRTPPYILPTDSVAFGDTSRLSASIMCVPVRFRGQALGIMSLQSYEPDAFSEADLQMFQGLADHCGGALDRIQALDDLRRSEALLNTQFKNSPDIILIVDRDLRFVTINRVVSPGLNADKLVGRDAIAVLPAEERERMRALLADCFATGRVYEAEHRLAGGDWARARIVPLPGDGRVANVMVISTVITERKAAEAALRDREALQRTILQTTRDSFCVVARDGKILQVNDAFCEMSGYSQKELLAMSIPDLEVNWPDPKKYARRLARILNAGSERFETRHRTKNGRIIELEISANILDPNGTRLCAFIRDITDRKRAEEALRKLTAEIKATNAALRQEVAQRRILEGRMLDVVEREKRRIGRDLHDGLCQMTMGTAMLSEVLGSHLRERSLLRQARQADRIARLIRSVGEEARRLSRGLSPVAMGADGLMAALEELALSTTSLTRIPCLFHCPSPVMIHDDEVAVHLFRIAQEAVNNAVRHARPGKIRISLRHIAGAIVLQVADDGRGLPSKPRPGRGMGFHVMRQRSELINATLQSERGCEGGTIITCRFPLPAGKKSSRPKSETTLKCRTRSTARER